jgi:hypothetical protein
VVASQESGVGVGGQWSVVIAPHAITQPPTMAAHPLRGNRPHERGLCFLFVTLPVSATILRSFVNSSHRKVSHGFSTHA